MNNKTAIILVLALLLCRVATAETTTLAITQDTCVLNGEYSGTNFCTDTQLYCGIIGDYTAATYIKTAYSIPPENTLISATLNIYDANHNATGNLRVCNVDNFAWDACSLTWSNQPGGNPPPYTEFTIEGNEWYAIDVTSLVAQWHDGTAANYGMLLYASSVQPGYCGFASSRFLSGEYAPYLTIEHETVAPVDLAPRSHGFALSSSPNPFNPQTVVRFELAHPEHVELVIHDLAGRHIATLVSAWLSAGEHAETWSGRTDNGLRVPSGVYFCRLKAGGRQEVIRMVMVE